MKNLTTRIQKGSEVAADHRANSARARRASFKAGLAHQRKAMHCRVRPHRLVASALVGVMLLLVLALAWSGQRASGDSISCGINQVTNTTGQLGSSGPTINANGTRIAFSSDRDLSGGNADNNFEIFLYDTTTNTFTQVTDTTGGGNFGSAISGDGTRIAFVSDRDLTGGNADFNSEIFLYNTTTNSIVQVTNTTGGFNGELSIDADGTRIAFLSDRDLTGGNADGNFEVFLYDSTTNSFTQGTNTTGAVVSVPVPSINGDGTRIAFSLERDLTGGNADLNREIFIYNTPTNSFTQVTNTTNPDGAFQPSISADGTRIVFISRSDLTGGNADGNREIFLYDGTTNSFTQVTNTTGVFTFSFPSINGNGTRIAFGFNGDLTGGNADSNEEIFLYDTTTNIFTQVTNTTGVVAVTLAPSISGDGTRITFSSDRDLTGGNADLNNEVFLASCLSAPCPLAQGYWKTHPSAWPVTTLTLGSQTYTQPELLSILNTPVGTGKNSDASLILADQLIAAKLSIANGSNPALISATITAADASLSSFTGKLPYKVKPSTLIGQQMTTLATTLEQYNSGLLTSGCGQ